LRCFPSIGRRSATGGALFNSAADVEAGGRDGIFPWIYSIGTIASLRVTES